MSIDGKTLVLTGTFLYHKRPYLEMALKALGAKVSGSVSKKTDMLFTGEKGGTKLAKAEALGLPVHDEEGLADLAEETMASQREPASPPYIDRMLAVVEPMLADSRVEMKNWEITDTSVRDSWPELALARYLGIPEEVLSFYEQIAEWRLSWKMAAAKLHAGRGVWIVSLEHLVGEVLPIGTKPKDLEKLRDEWREQPSAELCLNGHCNLAFSGGTYRGMEFAYHPGGVYEDSYALPFSGMSDYIDCLLAARGLPNWPMLLSDHEEALASPFFAKAAKAFDDFDPASFRERWGEAKKL